MSLAKSDPKPLLGIIGGMGPLASVYFYEMLTNIQKTGKEQDYIDILLYSIPSAPDRTLYITGKSGESPLGALIHAGRVLKRQNVTTIAIPCVTSHFFYDDLKKALQVPIINVIEETALYIAARGITKAGLLATDGTVRGRLFHGALAKRGIETIIPRPETQKKLMRLIYHRVKRGKRIRKNELSGITGDLYEQGAETVVLGCTELSLAVRGGSHNYIDMLEILTRASLLACGAECSG
jgi:aspartate racemase